MKIAIGCDDAALELKQVLKTYLQQQSEVPVEVHDFGIHEPEPIDYPDIAVQVAESIASGDCDRGILLCGTGLGMAIAANKVAGVRAATCHDVYSAQRAQLSNNAQILTLGARVVGPEVAKGVVASWLAAEFTDGRSTPKVAKINLIEQRYLREAPAVAAADATVTKPAVESPQ